MTDEIRVKPVASRDTAASSQARILLALGEQALRDGFAKALEDYAGCTVVHVCGDSDEALRLAEESRPDVAVVSAQLSPADGFRTVQEIGARVPGVSTILVSRTPTPADYRRGLQAGARDMLEVPVEKTDLYAALDEAIRVTGAKRAALEGMVSRALPAGEKQIATRIVVFSTKGGTGKTFVSTNLAALLAARGGRVALVDLDLQFGDVAIALGMTPQRTIHDLIQSYSTLDLTLLNDFMLLHAPSGVHVLPAPLFPEEGDHITAEDVELLLSVVQEGYDYVVVDTPPFFEDRILSALDWADHVLFIGSMDLPTLKNMKLSFSTMGLMSYPQEKLQIIMNRADSKVGLELGEVERHLGRPVSRTISSSIEVPRCLNMGALISLEKPNSAVSRALQEIAADLAPAADSSDPIRGGLFRRRTRHVSDR